MMGTDYASAERSNGATYLPTYLFRASTCRSNAKKVSTKILLAPAAWLFFSSEAVLRRSFKYATTLHGCLPAPIASFLEQPAAASARTLTSLSLPEATISCRGRIPVVYPVTEAHRTSVEKATIETIFLRGGAIRLGGARTDTERSGMRWR